MNVSLVGAAIGIAAAADRLRNGRAVILDVDGTLAETEEVHREAFNAAFAQTGLDWHWGRSVYRELLRVTGGKERIRAFDAMQSASARLSDPEIAELHRIKTARYAALIAAGDCRLRPGVVELLAAVHRRGQQLGLATTTSRGNIDALLAPTLGGSWEERFDAIVAGDDVAAKKPAPDVYLTVLENLGAAAQDCVAIEDSANGLVAAMRAGIPVIITRSIYFRDDDFTGAMAVVDDLTELVDAHV